MQINRRDVSLSLIALATLPVRNANAVIMSGGGGCGGGGWEEWPRGNADPLIASILNDRVRSLNVGLPRSATLDQMRQHHAAIFPQLVEQGFARMSPTRMRSYFRLARNNELTYLAALYNDDAAAQSRIGRLLPLLAVRADDGTLLRLTNIFGTMPMYEAVARYSPSRLAALEYAARGGVTAVPVLNQTFTPNLDMTVLRIYQGFRTAPIGASSVAASLYQTTMYAGGHLLTAFGGGYIFGTHVVLPFVETFFPSLYESLGSTINSILQGVSGGLLGVSVSSAQESATADFQITSYAPVLAETGGDYGAVDAWSISAGYGGGGC